MPLHKIETSPFFKYYAKQTAINVASINVYDHKRPEITTIENGL